MPYRTPSQKLSGDPGIFGTIGKILGGGLKLAGGLIPGPFGIPAKIAGGLLAPSQQRPGTPSFTPPMVRPGQGFVFPPTVQGRGTQVVPTVGGGTALAFGQKKRRRMDPMNVKALRRATRRLAAFDREKKKVEKQLRLIAPRPARRSRQDAPPGHSHVR